MTFIKLTRIVIDKVATNVKDYGDECPMHLQFAADVYELLSRCITWLLHLKN